MSGQGAPKRLTIAGAMEHSVLSVSCRVLLAACAELGLDPEALTRAAGVDRAVIEDPDGRLPPLAVLALWDQAYSASGDEHLALRVAAAIPPGAYRVLEYLVASAPTLGDALAKISKYFAWIDTSATLPLVEVDGLFGIGLEVAGPPELVPLRAVEFTFATCWAKARGLTRPGDAPARIDAAAPAPRDVARLEAFFGCPLRFAAGANRMLFERAVWEHRSPSADPSLLTVLEQHARALVEALEREPGVVGEVRRALYDGGPTQTLGEVARRLGLSTRTLQRRLSEAETPFAELAASVREHLARRLLAERRLALAEIAFVLGFADQSSFTRSFKRWTGRTPAAFRAAP